MNNRIDYVCFCGHHGYAAAAKNYIETLILHGCDVKLSPLDLGFPKQFYPDSYKRLNDLKEKPFSPERIQIFHSIPDMQKRFRDKKCSRTIGFATFETMEPPKIWIKILNFNHAVFVPSKFLFDEFKKAGIAKPMFHIPHCIDFNKFRPKKNEGTDKFKFMFFGSWKKRKGGQELVEAFFKEFSHQDDVQLIISGDQGGSIQADIQKIRRRFQGKQLPYLDVQEKIIPSTDVPNHLSRCDCLISPTMGEGFGLPGLQAMAVGTPIIITGWSGCTEYATEETATLLTPEKFVEIEFLDGIPQFRGCKWAAISVDQIAAKMRYVYEHREEALQKADVGTKLVREKFNYDIIFSKIKESFESLGWKK